MTAPLFLSAALAASQPVKQIDVADAGRVLATLDDWRGIMFSQFVVIGVLILAVMALVSVIVWLAVKRSANDQATLQALQDNTKALEGMAGTMRAMEVIVSRIEAERS